MIEKALPKKTVDVDAVKRSPSKGSSKKVSGSTGKPRYTYGAQEKSRDMRRPDRGKKKSSSAKKSGKPEQKVEVKVVPLAPGPLPVDHEKFAKQLGVRSEFVRSVARRFHDNPKLRGPEGFADFFHEHAREFVHKHVLDRHYFHRLYAHLAPRK